MKVIRVRSAEVKETSEMATNWCNIRLAYAFEVESLAHARTVAVSQDCIGAKAMQAGGSCSPR